MAAPISGAFRERFVLPYAGPQVWGTGYNSIHAVYGSPASRLGAIAPREGDVTPPFLGVPEQIVPEAFWGYTLEDERNTLFLYDDRPSWDVEPPENPSRYSTQGQPPANASGAAKLRFRSSRGGARRLFRMVDPNASSVEYMEPSETVSEGWLNKPQGRPANAKVSDPAQYERQTSLQQRYRARNNDLAVLRATDAERHHINSRVTGVRLKVYSEGERNYDMFPRQQTPMRNRRPFFYRTAGTGLQDQMEPNEMWTMEAVERTPPPDPYIGDQDTSIDYGYTPEDNFYA